MRFWFLGPQFDSGWDHFYVARVSVVGSGMEIGCKVSQIVRNDNSLVGAASTKSIWVDNKQACIFRCQALRRSEGHRTASCLVYLGHHHHRVEGWHYSGLLCSAHVSEKSKWEWCSRSVLSLVQLSCLVLSQFRQKQYGIVVTASWSKGKTSIGIHLALVK